MQREEFEVFEGISARWWLVIGFTWESKEPQFNGGLDPTHPELYAQGL